MIELLEILAICLVPLAMGWWPCPSCCQFPAGEDCVNCITSKTPEYLEVVVSGSIVGGDCDTCESIIATYKIKQETTNTCHWLLELCHCASNSVLPSEVFVQVTTIGGDYFLRGELVVRCSAGSDVAVFLKNLGPTSSGEIDCLAFSDEEMSFNAMQNDNDCCGTWTGVTMTVSATSSPQDEERQCSFLTWNTGSQYTATLQSAPADSDCTDCDELTTTVAMTQDDIPNCCRWSGTYAGSNCTYQYRLTVSETLYELRISDDNFTTSAIYQLTGLTFPHDGSVNRTLTFVSASSTACIWTGTTVLLQAA